MSKKSTFSLDALVTLYYGMQYEIFISMPIIALKDELYAIVFFKSNAHIGSFESYENAISFKTLQDAQNHKKKLDNKANAIYKLYSKRPTSDTRVE